MDEGDYATAIGALSSAVLGKKAVEAEAPSVRYLFNKPLRSAAQFVSGVGKDSVADAEATHETNMSNLRQGNLDDLRKAALLSLMVRLTGKRKFDPVAAYVLEKRATYVTSQG